MRGMRMGVERMKDLKTVMMVRWSRRRVNAGVFKTEAAPLGLSLWLWGAQGGSVSAIAELVF